MKKFFATVFALTCTAAHAASVDMQIQMIDSEIARLTIEKQQKYAELDKCAKSVNGFKIAGISLLGLTGVGIAVNISQAVKLDRLGDQINDERDRIAAAKTPVQTDITVVGPLRITEVVREIVADTDAVVAAIINNPDISAADKEVARAKAREITEIAASVPVSGSTDALETAQDEFDAIVTGAAMATGKPDVVASVEQELRPGQIRRQERRAIQAESRLRAQQIRDRADDNMAALNTELDGLQGQVRATRRFRNSLLGNISDIENKHLDAVLKEYYPDLIGAEALTPAQLQDLQRDWTQAKMNWIELGPELEAKLDELRDRKRDNNIRGITDVRDDKREVRQDQRNQLYQNDAQTRIEQVGFEIKDALELNINDNMTDANINAAARTLDRADNMISMLETQLRDDQFISDADYKLNYWDVVNRQRGAWVYELFQKRNALNTARDNKVRRDGDAARAKLQAEIDAKAAAILGK